MLHQPAKGDMMKKRAVTISDVSFSYDGVSALENVNLNIEEREFTAIIGPNGGGKTTLIKLMMGLLQPQMGSIVVFGVPPWSARRRFAYVPQHPRLDYEFPVTVMDVVLMGRLGSTARIGPYRSADRESAMRALDVVGCSNLYKRSFAALSSGQRQRSLIARALAAQPDILILDEPTANLDPTVQNDLYELLHELNKEMTVIIVSHDVGFVSKYVHKVACVNRQVVLHSASAIKGDVISTLYGEMNVRMVDHDHHSREP
ncbi:MAG: ABC transporter ATP-binding protein [Candidatus Krumholzibacteria bacterium]|nr:ABC transporter ATP-binding protein [Candidatus Krumholzibacteria bacterium]